MLQAVALRPCSFYERYAINDDLITDQEETGWKNIHGDVFRYPRHKSLLAASLGSGTRLLFVYVFLCKFE